LEIDIESEPIKADKVIFKDEENTDKVIAENKKIIHMVIANPSTHSITLYFPIIFNEKTKEQLPYLRTENLMNYEKSKNVMFLLNDRTCFLSLPNQQPCVCQGNGLLVMDFIVDDIPDNYLISLQYAVRTIFKQVHPTNPRRLQTLNKIIYND
jgi:hypothetical protein